MISSFSKRKKERYFKRLSRKDLKVTNVTIELCELNRQTDFVPSFILTLFYKNRGGWNQPSPFPYIYLMLKNLKLFKFILKRTFPRSINARRTRQENTPHVRRAFVESTNAGSVQTNALGLKIFSKFIWKI